VDTKTITVLDAVRMLHSAWFRVKPETIANCFRHAGFVMPDDVNESAAAASTVVVDSESEPAREEPAAPVRNIWDTLRATGLQIPDDLSFNDFCTADR